MPVLSRRSLLAAVPLGLAASRSWAEGSGFPDRPVTVIAGSAAGGPTDVITRLVAAGMAKELGQPVVVENGSGITIPAGRAAQARPDGYTLLVNSIGFSAAATLYRRLPFEVPSSFSALGLISNAAMTVVSRPDFPADDVQGLLAEMRRRKDELTIAHSGLGSTSHLCGMLLQQAAGVPLNTIVFRGSAPALTELMSGRIDLMCDQVTSTVSYIRENRLKAFSVTSEERVPGLEHLPTMREAGLPACTMSAWHGLYGPANIPGPVQQRLASALQVALRDPSLRRRFADLLTAPATAEQARPEYFGPFLAAEVARWRPIIQAAGVYAD